MRHVRKVHRIIPVVALAVAAAEASAQLMYEPFDYSTTNAAGNADLTNSIAAGGNSAAFGRTNQGQGTFWSRTFTFAAVDHTIDTGSLSSSANLPDAIGNKAAFASSGNVDRIGLGHIATSGRVYYSLLLKFDTLPAATSRIAGFNTFSLDQPGAATVFGSALTTRSSGVGTTTYEVGVAKNSATAQFDTRDWSVGQTLFIVGAYEINTTVGSDDVGYMWVNPDASDYGADFGADPGPAANRLTDTNGADLHDAVGGGASPMRNASLASFLLRANTTNSPWRIDELRIDTSWAGVTPRRDLQYAWNSTGGGTFGDATKWNSNAGAPGLNPNSLGAVANFGATITAPSSITTAGQTVDTVNIDNSNSLLIDGTGLTVSTNASAGQLIVRRGSHTVTAPLTLNDDLAIKVGSDANGTNGATLTLGGSVTGPGRAIGKYGLGTLKLGASNIIDDTAALVIRVGTLDLNGNNETVGSVIVGVGHRNTGADLNTSAQAAAGAITGAGVLSASSVQLENGSVSAALGGSATVLKMTQGVARLSGLSTYSGDTTIRAGTLLVGADAPSGAPGALGNSTNAILVSDAQTLSGTIDPGAAPKQGDPVSLLTDAAVTIGRNVVVNPEGSPTLGGNSAHNSTFAGNVTLNRATTFTAVAGGIVNFTGALTTNGNAITKTGAGDVVVENVRGGALTVSAGKFAIAPDSFADGVSNIGALTLAAGTKLDLTDNKLITTSAAGSASEGVYNGLQGQVQSAYNFGSWDGPGLTTSMQLALDGIATVGVATGEQIRGLGPSDTDVWAGQTINGTSTIAMYTYAGDANLDGQVDAGDYGILDAFIQIPGATGYGNGDFNYDGFIDPADYGTIDNSIQFQGPPLYTSGSAVAGLTAVPEPAAAFGLGLAAAVSLLTRRRRHV